MRILVACGGTSPEREVSLNSGEAVASALAEIGYEVIKADIKSPAEIIENRFDYNADGVFIALHGDWGEDGTIQTCLGAYGIPYTGSGPEGCYNAMYKDVARFLFEGCRVKVPFGYTKPKGSKFDERDAEILKKYGHLIVKPNSGGSTVGLTQVTEESQFDEALEKAWNSYIFEDKALIEQFIPGEEATCAVYEEENGEVIALPAVHIQPKTGFYDYKNKYSHGSTIYTCPADFSPEISKIIADSAVAAHKSLGCRVYSRTDFRITPDGEVYALETNTAPGMTSTSLVPKAAKAAGFSFPEFLDKVIKVSFAIKRRYM